jgi:hypothetical protein
MHTVDAFAEHCVTEEGWQPSQHKQASNHKPKRYRETETDDKNHQQSQLVQKLRLIPMKVARYQPEMTSKPADEYPSAIDSRQSHRCPIKCESTVRQPDINLELKPKQRYPENYRQGSFDGQKHRRDETGHTP